MTIISNIFRFLGKEFLNRSLIQQRSAQNSQHFVGTPVQFEVVLNDSHHAICSDGRVYLDSDSSLCRTPKGFDFEMLLNPFKEEFYTPTIFVEESNLCGTANSTILISWDIGMGLGILLGGVIAEYLGYDASFWTVVIINAAGVATFFAATKAFFLRRRLSDSVS